MKKIFLCLLFCIMIIVNTCSPESREEISKKEFLREIDKYFEIMKPLREIIRSKPGYIDNIKSNLDKSKLRNQD